MIGSMLGPKHKPTDSPFSEILNYQTLTLRVSSLSSSVDKFPFPLSLSGIRTFPMDVPVRPLAPGARFKKVPKIHIFLKSCLSFSVLSQGVRKS